MVVDEARGRLDELVGGGFIVFAREFDPRRALSPQAQTGLARAGASYVQLGGDGVRDVDGRLDAFLDAHGWAAMIVRPDFYVYGGAVDAAGLTRLADDLIADLEAAGLHDAARNEGVAHEARAI